MTPTDNVLNVGDYVTADSTWNPNHTGMMIFVISEDGTRTILDRLQIVYSRWDDIGLPRVLETGKDWLCWGDCPSGSNYVTPGEYLPYLKQEHYDANAGPESSETPVNQLPWTNAWLAYIAEAAHGVDHTFYTRTVQESGLGDRRTGLRYAHGLLGYAWFGIYAYSQIDPEIDRTGTDMKAWEADLPEHETLMANVCTACSSETFLRDFMASADLSAFKADMDRGNLSWIDRSVRPWTPGDVAYSIDLESIFELEYKKSLLYFDSHIVGALQVGTPHL